MSPPPPPPQQLPNRNLNKNPTLSPPPPSSSLSDFIFTVFSLFILISSPKPSSIFYHKFQPPISFPLNPRRFLSIPVMSITNRNPRRHNFPNPQSLADWLSPRLPSDSFASWGVKPGTKNVHNLWLELSDGETSLADSTPPVRTLEVVIVRIIGSNNRILVESHQELSDGSVRYRSRPLSEKMKPGETVDSAVIRAVEEELGSILNESNDNSDGNGDAIVRIVPNSYTKKVEERVSVSYPGLPACYVLHTVDALVDGLPDGEFCTEEGEEYVDSDEKKLADGAVSCKKHYWKWVNFDSV